MSDLTSRVDALESAIVGLAKTELGDSEGHDFHGNQYTGGGGSEGLKRVADAVKRDPQGFRDAIDKMNKEREAEMMANPSWNPKSGMDPIPAAHAKGDTVKLKEKINARSDNPLTGKLNPNDSFKLIKRGTEGKVLEVGDRFSVVQWKGLSTPQTIRNDMVKGV